MDFLKADTLPWLGVAQQRMRDSLHAERLPHSSLLLSAPGLGAERLADWMAALALCESPHGVPPAAPAPRVRCCDRILIRIIIWSNSKTMRSRSKWTRCAIS